MNTLVQVWASVATIIALGLGILHFANPYPLIQIPDRGHRVFLASSKEAHRAVLEVLEVTAGVGSYGTFFAGVHQTLMRDGFTVIAWGTAERSAISYPVENPLSAATRAAKIFKQLGIEVTITQPSPEQGEKLILVALPTVGFDIVYRLQGKDMPRPKWE